MVININSSPDDDNEQLERLTHQLNEDLRELDIDKVDLIRKGDAPIGAKGDVMTWGSLLVTLASSGVLSTLVNTLQSWLTRHERQSMTIEIGGDKLQITGISSEEQKRLIEDWINRHKEKANKNE